MKNIIDVSNQVKEMINRNNVQIMTLASIDKSLLNDYVTGRRKAIVIYRSKIFERNIQPIDDTVIEVIDEELGAYLKPGEKIVIVVPSQSQKRYVLQCSVNKVHVDRFRISIMDPRFNVRHQTSSPCNLKIYHPPALAIVKLQSGSLNLLRHANGKEEEYLIEKGKEETCSEYTEMISKQPLNGQLIDLSKGGMCINLGKNDYKTGENQMIFTDFSLSRKDEGYDSNEMFNIKVFGIVRACRKIGNDTFLHVMFLNTLESRLEKYFQGEKTG